MICGTLLEAGFGYVLLLSFFPYLMHVLANEIVFAPELLSLVMIAVAK